MIKIKAVERQVGFGKDEKKKRWFPAIYLSSDVTFEEFIDKVADETVVIGPEHLLAGGVVLVRKGRRNLAVGRAV